MNMQEENQRLKRLVVLLAMVLSLATILAFVIGSVEITHLNAQIAAIKIPQVVNGIDGKNGKDGLSIPGPSGPAGPPGQSVTAQQIAQAVAAYFIVNPIIPVQGPQGLAGINGQDGKTLQLKVDPDTCVLSEKYADDDSWTLIAQLQKPCTVDTSS